MYTFTEEQAKRIDDTIGDIVEDLYNLLEESNMYSIEVGIDHGEYQAYYNSNYASNFFDDTWKLILEHKSICIKVEESFYRFHLTKNNGKPKKQFPDEYLEICYDFIKNYDVNRKKVVEEIKRIKSESDAISRELNMTLDRAQSNLRLVKEASIELDFPPSQNPYEIEITKEDGRTVGKIDCGERIIKIYTDGDFVLVNRNKKEDASVKQKRLN